MNRVIAICCRISVDKSGKTEGVKAQTRWGTAYAAERWPGVPIEVFADGNNSAMTPGGPRPEHDRFKEWLAAGRIAEVWSVEQSRLERDEIEWFMLVAQLEAAGIEKVHTTRDGIIDVRGVVAGIMAVINAGEVRKLKKRLNDTLDDKAALGLPPGSKPFGYEHSTTPAGVKTYRIVPEQAAAIRWAAESVLAGWSLANIAKELGKRGLAGGHRVKIKIKDADGNDVIGDDGKPMVECDEYGNPITRASILTGGSVRNMVTVPSVAGFRVHRGQIIGVGNWTPILDEETWRACVTRLEGNRTVQRADGRGTYEISDAHRGNSTGRRYLLTGGCVICGRCNAELVGEPKKLRSGIKKPYLLCHPKKGGKGCVGIMLPETEQFVVDRLFDELDKPEFLEAVAADVHADLRDRLAADLRAIDSQRNELAAMWATPGALGMSEWQAARQALADNEQSLRGQLAEVPPPVINVDIAGAREAWPEMTLDEQREFIRLFVQRVTIKRATPGHKGFETARVDITWRKV